MDSIDEISLEEANAVGPMLSATVFEHALACSAPITIEPRDKTQLSIRNGSCVLVDTGSRTFGITNEHVIRPAVEAIANKSARVLIGQSHVQNFDDCIITVSKEYDLATFLVPPDALRFVRRDEKIDCRFATSWPPIAPVVDGGVFIAGWPGALRSTTDDTITARSFTGAFVVQSISERYINIVRDRQHEVVTNTYGGPNEISLGGMSGGPIFSLARVNGLIKPVLSGVVVEEHRALGIIKGVRVERIDEHGQIVVG